jgi:hypothetical protein
MPFKGLGKDLDVYFHISFQFTVQHQWKASFMESMPLYSPGSWTTISSLHQVQGASDTQRLDSLALCLPSPNKQIPR